MFTADEYIKVAQSREDYISLEERLNKCKEKVKADTEKFIQDTKDFCDGAFSEKLKMYAGYKYPLYEDIVLCSPSTEFSIKHKDCRYRQLMSFIRRGYLSDNNECYYADSTLYDYETFYSILKENGYDIKVSQIAPEVTIRSIKGEYHLVNTVKSKNAYSIRIKPKEEY